MSDSGSPIRGTCTYEGCESPSTGVCLKGEESPLKCSFFKAAAMDIDSQAIPTADGGRTFRSGLGLGYMEAGEVMRAAPTFIIPVVGLQEAGKTCYLMSLYSLCLAGRLLPQLQFAQSRSLIGFDTLARGIRKWDHNTLPEKVVPRTSSQITGREPAFLHVALKAVDDHQVLNFLFSDVPGEWFDALINRPASVSDDKLGFLHRADGLALLIEGPRLMDGGTKHVELSNWRYLLQRLFAKFLDAKNQVPIAVLLTKMDEVPQSQHQQLRQLVSVECAPFLSNFDVFICAAVSKNPTILKAGAGVKDALLFLKTKITEAVSTTEISFPGSTDRTFLSLASLVGAYRGI